MTIYYFDSSAVVKRYVDEPGSAWIRQLCDERDATTNNTVNLINIGEIAVVEVASALAILARQKIISKRLAERLYRKFMGEFRNAYKLAPISPALILAAASLTQQHPLKAYDAMQLAIALHLQTLLQADSLNLIFVCGDHALLQAAKAAGLATDNPFAHAA